MIISKTKVHPFFNSYEPDFVIPQKPIKNGIFQREVFPFDPPDIIVKKIKRKNGLKEELIPFKISHE